VIYQRWQEEGMPLTMYFKERKITALIALIDEHSKVLRTPLIRNLALGCLLLASHSLIVSL
jgi:hypothetical protein